MDDGHLLLLLANFWPLKTLIINVTQCQPTYPSHLSRILGDMSKRPEARKGITAPAPEQRELPPEVAREFESLLRSVGAFSLIRYSEINLRSLDKQERARFFATLLFS